MYIMFSQAHGLIKHVVFQKNLQISTSIPQINHQHSAAIITEMAATARMARSKVMGAEAMVVVSRVWVGDHHGTTREAVGEAAGSFHPASNASHELPWDLTRTIHCLCPNLRGLLTG